MSHPFENAVWIAPDIPCAAPRFFRRFSLQGLPADAVLHITGLGYFEARMNGHPVTDARLIPPASDYFRRDFSTVTYPVRDTFTHRIYYHSFPVRELLTLGENTLEIHCGGGWFVQDERIAEGRMSYADRPQCLFALLLDGETIVSDGSESYAESEIRESLLFLGETVDLTYRIPAEKPVMVLPAPDSILSPADGVHDGIIRYIDPKPIGEHDGVRIYDVGENVSALAELTTHAPAGASYTLRFSERLDAEGRLDFRSTGSPNIGTSGRAQIMCDRFVTDGEKRSFLPRFVWHAFRYFEVEGPLDALDSVRIAVIHARTDITAEFESDSEGLCFLYDAYLRTQLSNLHGSFPSDCPHRERLGYTGDGQITAEAAMMMLDCRPLYRKWIRDILDGQDKLTGHVQHTAPFQGGGGGPGGWGSAVVTVPYAYYRRYGGGEEILDEALDAMRRWIDFTRSCTEGGLVVRESEGGWCLGDWFMLKSARLPEPYVNTCWFIHAIRLYREMALALGRPDEEELAILESELLAAVAAEYEGLRDIGAASVYAAWLGLEDVAVPARYYEKLGSFDTGFLATDILCELLFSHGYGEVAYRLLSAEERGSFLYMKRRGATTLWERWDGGGSDSHPMFGGCARQLYRGILGIRQTPGSTAYAAITLAPCLPAAMQYARGSLMTPHGRLAVALERRERKARATVTVPPGIRGTILTAEGPRPLPSDGIPHTYELP